MPAEQTKIASNTTWFTLALILQKVISFVYFTYLARVLGAENLGQYVFALSFITIFSIVVDFGTNHFITREVAKDLSISQKIFSNILGFKLFSSIFSLTLVFIFTNILGYSAFTAQLIYLAGILMVIESFVLSAYAIIRGWHNLKFESIGTIGVQLIIVIAGIAVLQFTTNLIVLFIVLIGANFINLIYVFCLLHFKLKLNFDFYFNFDYWRKIFLSILPFALAAGFTKIYAAFDQILLSKLASNAALGFYAVAYKLTFALQFFPLALVASLYPAMSTYYTHDRVMLNKAFTRAVYYLIVLTIPLSCGIIFMSEKFILSLYTSAYADSVWPLQILIASLLFLFLNFPLGSLLNAANKQAKNTLNIALAMILNIVLNLALIPNYQAAGAAWASFISTLFLFILNSLAVRGLLKIDFVYLIKTLLKTFVSSVLMLLFMQLLITRIHWLLVALLGSLLYLVFQIILGTVTRRDINQIIQAFYKKKL